MSENTRIKCLVTGKLKVNTFIITNGNSVVIVDPGGDPELIIDEVKNYSDITILLTHSHYDHMGATNEVMAALPEAKLYAHKKCVELASNTETNICQFLMGIDYALEYPATEELSDKVEFFCGDIRIIPLHSTGHSGGHLCYYLPEEKAILCGDMLTAEDIGRHDVPGSNLEEMIEDCLKMLKYIPAETMIYPGHGREILPEEVMRTNQHLKNIINNDEFSLV